jgi:uncharacterized membrane protein YfcA
VPAGLILMPTQPVSTVIGSLKVPSFIGTCFATYQYLQRVKIPFLRILLFTSIALTAAFSGSLLLTRMSSQFMKPVIFFVLLILAIYTFTKKDLGQSVQKENIKSLNLPNEGWFLQKCNPIIKLVEFGKMRRLAQHTKMDPETELDSIKS